MFLSKPMGLYAHAIKNRSESIASLRTQATAGYVLRIARNRSGQKRDE
jgi:hypothetical protein